MNSGTKGYLVITGIVLYHVAALYAIMLLLDLHLTIASLAALAWLISLPVTLWKTSKYASVKTDGVKSNITNLFDNSKE